MNIEIVSAAIKKEITRIIEEEAAEAQDRVAKRVHAQADSLALMVLKEYSITTRGEEIVIVVKKMGAL
jgi:hypothetical protein